MTIKTIIEAETFLDGFSEIKKSKKDIIPTTRMYAGRTVKKYRGPTKNIINKLQEFFIALHMEDPEGIRTGLKDLKFKGFRFEEAPGTVFFGAADRNLVAINFFWRFGETVVPGNPSTYENPVDQMILEAPHEGTDNTYPISVHMFVNTRARILIGNGVRNQSGEPGGVKCQTSRKYKSDGAHYSETLFNKVHMIMASMYPDSVFPQIHGMKAKGVLIVNCTNSHFTDPEKSGAEFLGRSIGKVWPNKKQLRLFTFCGNVTGKHSDGTLYRDIFRRPKSCHNTTRSAHVLNPGGSQCSKGSKDSGRFIHIEFPPTFRINQFKMYRKNLKNFALALNQLMVLWNEKPGNPRDYKIVKNPLDSITENDTNDDTNDDTYSDDIPDVIEDGTIENYEDEDILGEDEKMDQESDEDIPDDNDVQLSLSNNVQLSNNDVQLSNNEESMDEKITRLVQESVKKIVSEMINCLEN